MATIVDFADLKVMLNLEKDSFTDYPDLELIADEVHSALEAHVGRKLDIISRVTETGITIGPSNNINLINLPIVSVESVVIEDIIVTSDEYTVDHYGISIPIRKQGAWTITSKGGFKVIPDVIYRAELSQIVYEFQNKNNLAATIFTNSGGGTTVPGFVLLTQVTDMLKPFVHIDKMGY